MAKQLKEIEIPFGAKDSELCDWEYTIPEGMEATIVNNKIVVKKKERDERIKKELIRFVKSYFPDETSEQRKAYLAWLEKQGEQKPDDNVESITQSYITPNSEFFQWIYNRLIYVYRENPNVDYMLSLKERIKDMQNHAWSEEDEELLHDVSDTYFYNDEDYPEETYKQMLKRVLDWMNKRAKSLRPQNQWKLSDLPHWKKSTLPNDNTTGFNSENFCHNGYYINYKELFEKLPKDD